ncbi:MAG: universal stress protein [Alphaproteobacteria bacterium]|nr:universal stress protein [Alphaproteobacteria bacterium]
MTQHVLLPVDPDENETWRKALPEAVTQARLHGATLHVMTVVPTFGSSIVANYFPKDFEKKAIADAEGQLKALIANQIPADLPHQLIVAHGRVHQEICRVAEEIGAGLIVMASHKPDWSDTLLAPNAAQVLQHAPVSVMVVR